jgi:hypothetical protein
MMNIVLEARHLNPLSYCDLMLGNCHCRLVCRMFTRPLLPIHALSSLYNLILIAILPLITVSHLRSAPPSHLLSDEGPLNSLAYLSSDWLISVTRRLVFTRRILRTRPQYRYTYTLCYHPSYGIPTLLTIRVLHTLSPELPPPTPLASSRNPESRLRPATRIYVPI